jgi:hypothetical protein
MIKFDLGNELSEVFVIGKRLLDFLLLDQEKLDWDLTWLVGVRVRKPNWNVYSQDVLAFLNLVND